MNAFQTFSLKLVTFGFVGMGMILAVTGGCGVNYVETTSTGITGDFLTSGRTLSNFQAFQIDPQSEDSAGPQFVASADLNGDGFIDLVSAWNQSQPVQVHLQRRNAVGGILFETLTLAGSIPAVSVAGLEVADFDNDGAADIAVLIKISLLPDAGCLDSDLPPEGTLSGLVLLYMGPSDPDQANQALAWEEIPVEISRLPAPTDAPDSPEVGGFTALAVDDINMDGAPDILVASNISCDGAASDVLLFTNQGPGAIQDGTWRGEALPNPFPRTTIKDIEVADIDNDGDPDIVATFPDAPSMNVRWFRNPVVDDPDDFHFSDGEWHVGSVAQIATGADVIELGDIDRDGNIDVVMRSSEGRLIQWLQNSGEPTSAPVRNIPWRVYTVAEFTDRVPEAIALVDLNFDGQLEIVATAEGGLVWFDSRGANTVFDQWTENLIVDDSPAEASTDVPATTDPSVEPEEMPDNTTFMNTIFPIDLDGDGSNDLIVPLDRKGLSGLTNDALVWFRNLRN
ncbi:MAG: FG-GAP repeat domain-containing protein [Planctomycetota bacterium]|jgi:hypothetical protein